MTAFQDEFEEKSLKTLYSKMKKTTKARFNCSHRLAKYNKLNLWTLSLFSGGLLVLSVTKQYGISVNVTDNTFFFIQFILGLLILIISLLLSAVGGSDRAEKMHRCALEINELCHKVIPKCKEDEKELKRFYERTMETYNTILNSYENHDLIDFEMVKLELADHYDLSTRDKLWIRVKYTLTFWLHISLFVLFVSTCIGIYWP